MKNKLSAVIIFFFLSSLIAFAQTIPDSLKDFDIVFSIDKTMNTACGARYGYMAGNIPSLITGMNDGDQLYIYANLTHVDNYSFITRIDGIEYIGHYISYFDAKNSTWYSGYRLSKRTDTIESYTNSNGSTSYRAKNVPADRYIYTDANFNISNDVKLLFDKMLPLEYWDQSNIPSYSCNHPSVTSVGFLFQYTNSQLTVSCTSLNVTKTINGTGFYYFPGNPGYVTPYVGLDVLKYVSYKPKFKSNLSFSYFNGKNSFLKIVDLLEASHPSYSYNVQTLTGHNSISYYSNNLMFYIALLERPVQNITTASYRITVSSSYGNAIGDVFMTLYPSSLSIEPNAGGNTNPTPGFYGGQPGDVIQVTAIPSDNYEFDKWIGSAATVANEKNNPINVSLTSEALTLKPVFKELPYVERRDLIVSFNPTKGKVKVNGTLLSETTSLRLEKGTKVKIEAVPNENYKFDAWDGDMSAAFKYDPVVEFYLHDNKDITAIFVFDKTDTKHTLTILFNNQKGNIVANGQTYNQSFNLQIEHNSIINLKAEPKTDYKFDYWDGVPDAFKYDDQIEFPLTESKTISVVFTSTNNTEDNNTGNNNTEDNNTGNNNTGNNNTGNNNTGNNNNEFQYSFIHNRNNNNNNNGNDSNNLIFYLLEKLNNNKTTLNGQFTSNNNSQNSKTQIMQRNGTFKNMQKPNVSSLYNLAGDKGYSANSNSIYREDNVDLRFHDNYYQKYKAYKNHNIEGLDVYYSSDEVESYRNGYGMPIYNIMMTLQSLIGGN